MKIIAFVGNSGSGKTRLITRLIPELRKRGLTVAVIKHCAHEFDLGGPDKDSTKYLAAGARGAGLVSDGTSAVIRKGRPARSLAAFARAAFAGTDLVLIEGGRSERRLKKIEVLRRGVSAGVTVPAPELAAVVANIPVAGAVPVFRPTRTAEIADWLTAGWR